MVFIHGLLSLLAGYPLKGKSSIKLYNLILNSWKHTMSRVFKYCRKYFHLSRFQFYVFVDFPEEGQRLSLI